MDGPASSVSRALNATFALLGRGAAAWLPLALGLGWLAAVPSAVAERWLGEALEYVITPYGYDPNGAMAVLTLASVALLVQLILQLVALVLLYIIAADLAAGRPVSLVAGLRRTLGWRLQLSWLLSSFVYSTATRLWFMGGCLLFVPMGMSIPDAYETDSGLGAFRRSQRLGNLRIGGGRGPQPGWTLAGASTALLLLFAVLSGVTMLVDWLVAPATPGLEALLSGGGALGTATSPAELLQAIVPHPSWVQTGWAIAQGPLDLIREMALLTVGLVVYQDARRHLPEE